MYVESFTGGVQSLRFLRRKLTVLFPLLTVLNLLVTLQLFCKGHSKVFFWHLPRSHEVGNLSYDLVSFCWRFSARHMFWVKPHLQRSSQRPNAEGSLKQIPVFVVLNHIKEQAIIGKHLGVDACSMADAFFFDLC